MAILVTALLDEVDEVLAQHSKTHRLVAVIARSYVATEYELDDTSMRYPLHTTHHVRELYFEARHPRDLPSQSGT